MGLAGPGPSGGREPIAASAADQREAVSREANSREANSREAMIPEIWSASRARSSWIPQTLNPETLPQRP